MVLQKPRNECYEMCLVTALNSAESSSNINIFGHLEALLIVAETALLFPPRHTSILHFPASLSVIYGHVNKFCPMELSHI